jgi:hypothetical protein
LAHVKAGELAEICRSVESLMAESKYDEAWTVCHRALTDFPQSAELLVSAAALRMRQDRAAEAEKFTERALAIKPDSSILWNNLGLALRNQNRLAESLDCFERAISLARTTGEAARAHYDRAFALLLGGSYREGFRDYEHRWRANGMERPGDRESEMLQRLWRGENIVGRRILIYSEQGLGDTIQFVRYAALLIAQGAHVILEVQPVLRGLMGWLQPECEVGSGEGAARFDYHCSMMTLPLNFETTLETVPPPAILSIPSEMLAKWQAKIVADGHFKVGLVWAGSPENPMDDRRSARLAALHLLLSDPDCRKSVRFFSFQVGPRAADLDRDPYRDTLRDLSADLIAATETAAALKQMNLVITVDTFVAHLAATLGIKVWVLLAFSPDWRWLLEREKSPWYSSVRLFRQSAAGDWEGVVERVCDALGRECEDAGY